MNIFKTISSKIVNTTTNISDFARGIGANIVDNRVIDTVKDIKELGRYNRMKAKAEKTQKKLEKLQKAQAELEAKQTTE